MKHSRADLRAIRKKANLNQTDLAKKLGVSVSTVSHWEQGVQQMPLTACLLVEALETVDRLEKELSRRKNAQDMTFCLWLCLTSFLEDIKTLQAQKESGTTETAKDEAPATIIARGIEMTGDGILEGDSLHCSRSIPRDGEYSVLTTLEGRPLYVRKCQKNEGRERYLPLKQGQAEINANGQNLTVWKAHLLTRVLSESDS